MKQKLSNPPETDQEAEHQKRPVPVKGIVLAVCLVAAFLLFFGPAFIASD